MQRYMPLIFAVIYINIAAGVNIYFIVSSLCRIGIQEAIFRSGALDQAAPAAEGVLPSGRRGHGGRTRDGERMMERLAEMQKQALRTERSPATGARGPSAGRRRDRTWQGPGPPRRQRGRAGASTNGGARRARGKPRPSRRRPAPRRPTWAPRETARVRGPKRRVRTAPGPTARATRSQHIPARRRSGRGRIDSGMEWVETTGRTVAEAKDAALDQLGVDDADAEFVVVNEPRAGLFGRMRGEARVRARVRPTSPRPKRGRSRRPAQEQRRDGGGRGGAGRADPGSTSVAHRRTEVDDPGRRMRRPRTAPAGRVEPTAVAAVGRAAGPDRYHRRGWDGHRRDRPVRTRPVPRGNGPRRGEDRPGRPGSIKEASVGEVLTLRGARGIGPGVHRGTDR